MDISKIVIRPAESRDGEILEKWWNDGRVMAHAGFPDGLGTTAARIREDLMKDSELSGQRLILEYDGTPIGEMNYRVKDSHRAEIGIKICETAYQEKGLGRAALSILIRYLFDRGFTTVALDTNPDNRRARHVYEKLGFHQVRIRKNCWRDQRGVLRSAVDYELKEEDFNDFSGGNRMNQIERIRHYEALKNRAEELISEVSEKMEELDKAIRELNEYYTGKNWKKDFAADEAGKLPADLLRGVLSEDGLYDLFDRYGELKEDMARGEDGE